MPKKYFDETAIKFNVFIYIVLLFVGLFVDLCVYVLGVYVLAYLSADNGACGGLLGVIDYKAMLYLGTLDRYSIKYAAYELHWGTLYYIIYHTYSIYAVY